MTDRNLLRGKQNFIRDDTGLERIYQEYYFKTSDLDYFISSVFTNGAGFGAVNASTVLPTAGIASFASTEGASLGNMAIEKVDYENLSGGVSIAKATFVGLYTTSTPAPKFEIIPIDDNRWIHSRFYVKATFIAYLGKPNSLIERQIVQNRFGNPSGTFISAPGVINNVAVPRGNNITPYRLSIRQWSDKYSGSANLRWNNCALLGTVQDTSQPPADPLPVVPADAEITYSGWGVTAMNLQRFGLFGLINLTIKEVASVRGFGATGTNGISASCTSTLNAG